MFTFARRVDQIERGAEAQAAGSEACFVGGPATPLASDNFSSQHIAVLSFSGAVNNVYTL